MLWGYGMRGNGETYTSLTSLGSEELPLVAGRQESHLVEQGQDFGNVELDVFQVEGRVVIFLLLFVS